MGSRAAKQGTPTSAPPCFLLRKFPLFFPLRALYRFERHCTQ
nr:MAG TPA: hypothetical protein [Caudoviricetes sp.]